MADPIIIAKNATMLVDLLPNMANRHGLVAGATGTGKTVTLQVLAEGLSRAGVSVYMSGSSTFSSALVRASRLNCWKTNPIFLFRISASWSRFSFPTLIPSSL